MWLMTSRDPKRWRSWLDIFEAWYLKDSASANDDWQSVRLSSFLSEWSQRWYISDSRWQDVRSTCSHHRKRAVGQRWTTVSLIISLMKTVAIEKKNPILSPPKERGYVFYLCLSVCLSVCPIDYSKSYERILIKFFGGSQRNNRFGFGDDPYAKIFKMILYLLLRFLQTESQEQKMKNLGGVWTLWVLPSYY